MFDKCLSLIILLIFWLMQSENTNAQNAIDDLPYKIPEDIVELQPRFHFAPVNQDTTNACWSYSTLSFIESELQRLNGQSVKLAEMFPVYSGFIEKSKRFAETRGQSRFEPGDLFTTAMEIVQTYGILPEDAYRGQVVQRPTRNHNDMEKEIEGLKKRIIDEGM